MLDIVNKTIEDGDSIFRNKNNSLPKIDIKNCDIGQPLTCMMHIITKAK